jgi:hypothetical protein
MFYIIHLFVYFNLIFFLFFLLLTSLFFIIDLTLREVIEILRIAFTIFFRNISHFLSIFTNIHSLSYLHHQLFEQE